MKNSRRPPHRHRQTRPEGLLARLQRRRGRLLRGRGVRRWPQLHLRLPELSGWGAELSDV